MKAMVVIMGLALSMNASAKMYEGSTYASVWSQVSSDTYKVLPKNKISVASLFGFLENKIKIAANRTLSDRSDVLPQFRKLAHPNGTCLTGTWEITEENPYGGYFKKGSEALIVARASTAMSGTTVGKNRGFGLAGKLFPTNNPLNEEKFETANFFLVDDLGGTKARHYTDVEMTNAPTTTPTMAVIAHAIYAIKLAITFGKADSNPGIRQVYEISELGEDNPKSVRTPEWMKVGAQKGQTVDRKDFRDELRIENYAGELLMDISVASKEVNGKKNWKKIGVIRFTDSEVSNSCDHRLHFHHPKWRSNLNH